MTYRKEGEIWAFAFQGRTAVASDLYAAMDTAPIAKQLDCEPGLVLQAILRAHEDEIKRELRAKELQGILGLTVKHDDANKVITFLCMLSAYAEDGQFNISFRAESSTGKSYIPLEIMQLFPSEDVKDIAYSSPKAFFHDRGEWDDFLQGYRLDLERKILVFLDQPHDMLLQYMRPLLSHDKKELIIKITDKSEKKGLRTKNIILRGYPSVVFCTGSLTADQQEATRMLLLSPETSQEKLREAILLRALREANSAAFKEWIERDSRRRFLKERVRRIKEAQVRQVIIPNPEDLVERYISTKKFLKPRDARDISRLESLAKGFALLNLWNRERDDHDIIANQEDIDNGFRLYEGIAIPQELGIPPYVYRVWKEIILELDKKNQGNGVAYKDISREHLSKWGRPLSYTVLRKQIVPALEASGLVTQEPDPIDRRKMLIFPVREESFTPPLSDQFPSAENRSSQGGGT